MKLYSRFAAALSLVLLSACASNFTQLEKADPQALTFESSLASEYLDYARAEKEQSHWMKSNYFAGKGLKALRGEKPAPEEVRDRSVAAIDKLQMDVARKELVSLLGDNSRSVVPQKAARAQMLFDCWVVKKEDNAPPEEIASCHDEFVDTMDDLRASPGVVETPMPHFEVSFAMGSTEVDDAGKNIIDKAVKVARNLKTCHIHLIGHTDRVGSAQVNKTISKARAEAVKTMLEAKKLCDGKITIDAMGEASPKLRVPNGIAESQNRRVEIEIMRGEQ